MDLALVADVHFLADRVTVTNRQDFSRSVDGKKDDVIRRRVSTSFCIRNLDGDVTQVESVGLNGFTVRGQLDLGGVSCGG